MYVIVSFLEDGEQDEEDEKEEKEEEVEEEPEEELENNDSYGKINVETLISENGDSSTLDLSVQGLVDDDMIIIGNLLKNKKVSKQKISIIYLVFIIGPIYLSFYTYYFFYWNFLHRQSLSSDS